MKKVKFKTLRDLITEKDVRRQWTDGDCEILKDKYKIENRHVIPYSTQQYTALWVDRAKKAKKCLILNRIFTFKL